MSLSAASASQISAMEPRVRSSQFHARMAPALFVLCLRMALSRNDVTFSSIWFRAITLRRHKLVQGQYCAMRPILAIILLCTALAWRQAQAEPSAETIAHGKALTEAADCASCHTADPAKPFAGGKRIDPPFRRIHSPNLTPDRDTGIGGWSDREFYRALHFGVARDGSRYYPAFPYPNFTRM